MTERPAHLRPVDTGGQPQDSVMHDAVIRMAEQIAALNPVTVLMVAETKSGNNQDLRVFSIPDSVPLRKGMADELFRSFFPEEEPA